MKKTTKIIMVFAIIVVLFFVYLNLKSLEIVPNSYGLKLDANKDDSYIRAYSGITIAIKFVVPTDCNVINEAYFDMGGGTWDIVHEIGLSRVMSTNSDVWLTHNTFKARPASWNGIKDLRLQSTGGIVRCDEGEILYLMIKANPASSGSSDCWFGAYGSSSYSELTPLYTCNAGENVFNYRNFGGALRIYGYEDQNFFVDFEYTPQKPTTGDTITFIDTSNQDLLESRQWIIDGAVVASSYQFTYSFLEEGRYSVTLLAISYAGTNLQMNKLIDVINESGSEEVTCYMCLNNQLISDKFDEFCPNGWYLLEDVPENYCVVVEEPFNIWLMVLLFVLLGIVGVIVWKRKHIF